jgi:hypothetical protein
VTAVARRLTIVLIALMTAACSLTNTGNPNVAATIGDETIPVSVVEGRLDAEGDSTIESPDGQAAFDSRAQVLTELVLSEFLARMAQRNDIQVSDADVDDSIAQITEQLGGEEALPAWLAQQGMSEETFRRRVREQTVFQALQQKVGDEGGNFDTFFREELARMPVEVNPRYGEWDENALQVRPLDPFASADEQAAGGGQPPADDAASPPPER